MAGPSVKNSPNLVLGVRAEYVGECKDLYILAISEGLLRVTAELTEMVQ